MAGEIVKKAADGTNTTYDEMKSKAVSALAKVGKTFTWTSSVSSSTIAMATAATEIMNAVNLAYDNVIVSGGALNSDRSDDSMDCGNNSVNSDNGDCNNNSSVKALNNAHS